MGRLVAVVGICLACLVWRVNTEAQGRGGTDWMTSNADAQRSAWIRTDPKISPETMQKPGFKFLWKLRLNNQPKQLNSLAPPATLERLIGYRGFRTLAFVGGSSDKVFTIDTDLGRMEWERQLASTAAPPVSTLACPGGMTTSVVRQTVAGLPSLAGGSGFGRSTAARGAVGAPGSGAVTLAPAPRPVPGRQPAAPNAVTRRNPANPSGGQFERDLVYALSSDGMLHSMHMSNGADYEPPVKFLPPNANASGLIVVDGIAYVVTQGDCGGVASGVWALDLDSKQVKMWQANVVGLAGTAFGEDGTLYVATGSGGESPNSLTNSLVALEAGTLKVKGWYSAGSQEFSSTPVVFAYKGKTLVSATTRDGRLHLFDGTNLGGADHPTPLVALSTTSSSLKTAAFVPGAMASWQERNGTRWILAPVVGMQAVELGFAAANGPKDAVVAWKIIEQNGAPMPQPAWVSRELVSPLVPTIINGVAFVTSSGEAQSSDSKLTAAQRAERSSPAVLYALDAATGRELWSSGTTITSFARGGALAGGAGQVYLTTYDGMIYTFGFPMEH